LGEGVWGVIMIFHRVTAVAAMLCLAGCASVVEGTTQQIFVTTTPETGATCTASNGRGEWSLVTPATITVKKSESVLKIRCSKTGWQEGTFYAAGKMSGASLAGNMLPYVGLLNAAVDGSTGAALSYPGSYSIELKPLPAPSGAPQTSATLPVSPSGSLTANQTH
jgi:hypothetical protein